MTVPSFAGGVNAPSKHPLRAKLTSITYARAETKEYTLLRIPLDYLRGGEGEAAGNIEEDKCIYICFDVRNATATSLYSMIDSFSLEFIKMCTWKLRVSPRME